MKIGIYFKMYSSQPHTLKWHTRSTTAKLISLQATITILFLYTCLADQCLQLWNYTATNGTMISTQVKKNMEGSSCELS